MQDNALIRVFLPMINTGLASRGYTGVVTQQAYQPTQQGVNVGPTVYFYKVGDHRLGFLKREDVWDEINDVMTHTETQWYETTFQISSLVTQNPKNTYFYTASDLVNSVAQILQSDTALTIFQENEIGIYKVSDVSNIYFYDDRDRFEAAPAFNFTLTHKQTRITEDPVLESVQLNIKRV